MSLYTLHEKTQSRDLFYMKLLLNDETKPVDPRLLNDIL